MPIDFTEERWDQIDAILDELRVAYYSRPELRLGQIIVAGISVDPFHVDDAVALKALKQFNSIHEQRSTPS